jgi:hypothetical protein
VASRSPPGASSSAAALSLAIDTNFAETSGVRAGLDEANAKLSAENSWQDIAPEFSLRMQETVDGPVHPRDVPGGVDESNIFATFSGSPNSLVRERKYYATVDSALRDF